MDIEEIKCALCSKVYNDNDRMPTLLPDCGHSFCYLCIQDCFELLKFEKSKAQESQEIDGRLKITFDAMKNDQLELSREGSDEGNTTLTNSRLPTYLVEEGFISLRELSPE